MRPTCLARRVEAARGIDDPVGARALFGVGHLAGKNPVEPFGSHSRAARAHARAAFPPGPRRRSPCRTRLPRRFRTTRECRTARPAHRHWSVMKRVRSWWTAGWTIASSAASSSGSPSTARGKRLAIDRAVAGGAGKARLDRRHQPPARPLQRAHRRRRHRTRERRHRRTCRDGRLAHADRSGERDADHGRSLCHRSASRSRGGSLPNNSLKLAAACSTSMSSPVTTASPRSRAAAMSGVSAGALTMSNTRPSAGIG